MNRNKLIEQMLKQKGDANNRIDLDAYCTGLIDMFNKLHELNNSKKRLK